MTAASHNGFIGAEQIFNGSAGSACDHHGDGAKRGSAGGQIDAGETVARLAALSALDYDQVREAEAERLNVRVTTLDKVVDGVRRQAGEADSDAVDFLTDPEPWPVPVNGVDLLDRPDGHGQELPGASKWRC